MPLELLPGRARVSPPCCDRALHREQLLFDVVEGQPQCACGHGCLAEEWQRYPGRTRTVVRRFAVPLELLPGRARVSPPCCDRALHREQLLFDVVEGQ
ncbi:hypothetical protein, partial [Streptomyces sp. NPDC048710]|uniref:hypothetical protein n=1 Tax=Streptomyces sp. NPDC048710 TaxID=3365586 RepID=UPI003722BB73